MRKVKWGVLGTADILGCTGPGMAQAEHCERYAIAGRKPEKVQAFKERYGFEKAYGSYEELLLDPAVEAVYIPLSNELHYEWTIRALQHGKHVLCEKPLAPSAEQAAEMFQTAKENDVFLMEAFAYQHSPYIAALEKEIQDGTIGEPRYIETAFLTSNRGLGDFRLWRDRFGGSLYDLGVYNTSFILRMLGEEPVKVQAVADFSEQGVDLLTSAQMLFEGGKRAAFTCGMILETGKSLRFDRFEIQGTEGAIHSRNFIYNGSGEMQYEVEIHGGKKETKTVFIPDNYMLEVEQLSLCALGEATPCVTEEFSLQNARMIDGVLKAIGY